MLSLLAAQAWLCFLPPALASRLLARFPVARGISETQNNERCKSRRRESALFTNSQGSSGNVKLLYKEVWLFPRVEFSSPTKHWEVMEQSEKFMPQCSTSHELLLTVYHFFPSSQEIFSVISVQMSWPLRAKQTVFEGKHWPEQGCCAHILRGYKQFSMQQRQMGKT